MSTLIKSWQSAEAAAEQYAKTLVWEEYPRGLSVHIGGGVWRSTCSECDSAVDHYGTMPRYATIGPHEVEAHNLAVPGVNVGMLS